MSIETQHSPARMAAPDFPEDPARFRACVRERLRREYAAFIAGLPASEDRHGLALRRAWEDRLCAAGLAGLGWPRRYGGHELDLARQAIFHEEHAECGAPLGVNLIGHGILAPTVIHYGTEAQKQRFLPGILSTLEIWCQGYSEPQAGSDLAAVRTRARRDGQGYVLSGHKIWTSFADQADWCFVLARTDPAQQRHRGLSFLLVNMRQPGVRVHPIRQITGDAEFCEVFFEDARVEAEALVGEENQGWKIAMSAASFERGTYFIPRLVKFRRELMWVRALLRERAGGLAAADGAELERRWARLAVDSHVLDLKSRRALAAAATGEPPGPQASSTKIHWSEAHQSLLDFAVELLGDRVCTGDAQRDPQAAELVRAYLSSRAETILAGTSEIQRNIIAERVLGLPKGVQP